MFRKIIATTALTGALALGIGGVASAATTAALSHRRRRDPHLQLRPGPQGPGPHRQARGAGADLHPQGPGPRGQGPAGRQHRPGQQDRGPHHQGPGSRGQGGRPSSRRCSPSAPVRSRRPRRAPPAPEPAGRVGAGSRRRGNQPFRPLARPSAGPAARPETGAAPGQPGRPSSRDSASRAGRRPPAGERSAGGRLAACRERRATATVAGTPGEAATMSRALSRSGWARGWPSRLRSSGPGPGR